MLSPHYSRWCHTRPRHRHSHNWQRLLTNQQAWTPHMGEWLQQNMNKTKRPRVSAILDCSVTAPWGVNSVETVCNWSTLQFFLCLMSAKLALHCDKIYFYCHEWIISALLNLFWHWLHLFKNCHKCRCDWEPYRTVVLFNSNVNRKMK